MIARSAYSTAHRRRRSSRISGSREKTGDRGELTVFLRQRRCLVVGRIRACRCWHRSSWLWCLELVLVSRELIQNTQRVSLICVQPLDEKQLRVRSCERVRDP